MPFVLTKSAAITCPHGGKVDFSTLDAKTHKLTIGGVPALLETDIVTIVGCTNSSGVCTTITVTAGKSGILTVGGKAVMLSSFVASTKFAPILTLLSTPTKIQSL